MAIIDKNTDSLIINLVIDGPAESGKTTTLRSLTRALNENITTFSPGQASESTEFFDWAEYVGGLFQGNKIHCQLITVPGRPALNYRREFILKQADAVIMVMDAGQDHIQQNLDHYHRLKNFLNSVATENNAPPIGVVVQANKQDAEQSLSAEAIKEYFGKDEEVSIIATQATTGTGLREEFALAVRAGVARAQALKSAGKMQTGKAVFENSDSLFHALQTLSAADEIAPGDVEPLSTTDNTKNNKGPSASTEMVNQTIDAPSPASDEDESIVSDSSATEEKVANNATQTEWEDDLTFIKSKKLKKPKLKKSFAEKIAKSLGNLPPYLSDFGQQYPNAGETDGHYLPPHKDEGLVFIKKRDVEPPQKALGQKPITKTTNGDNSKNSTETPALNNTRIAFPIPGLSNQQYWPQDASQVWSEEAHNRSAELKENEMCWFAYYSDGWTGRLNKSDIFSSFEEAKARFRELIRYIYKAAGVLSPVRFLAIAPFSYNQSQFSVWQICKYQTSIKEKLTQLSATEKPDTLAKEICVVVDLLAKQLDNLLKRTGHRDFCLDDIMIEDGQILSLDFLDFIANTNHKFTQGELEQQISGQIKALLNEKISESDLLSTQEQLSLLAVQPHASDLSRNIISGLS